MDFSEISSSVEFLIGSLSFCACGFGAYWFVRAWRTLVEMVNYAPIKEKPLGESDRTASCSHKPVEHGR